ncbi:MAG: division/cell wall cluster transcriptional repressor MraZ [Anaerolineales bacterium]
MFLGEYRHSVDDKGRLTVPFRYRQLLEDGGGYITEGIDPNLLVWQKDTFERMAQAIQALSFTDKEVREFGRLFFSSADRVQPDGSGRILVPQFLRDKHSLNGEVVLVGAGLYFEVWSPAEWVKQTEKLGKVQENADYFAKLNLFLKQSE